MDSILNRVEVESLPYSFVFHIEVVFKPYDGHDLQYNGESGLHIIREETLRHLDHCKSRRGSSSLGVKIKVK